MKVLASDPIDPICKEIFKSNGHSLVEKPNIKKNELLKIISEYDCLIIRSRTKVDKDIISAGVNLKYIGRAGSGCDNIDIHSATSKGVLVVNTPGNTCISSLINRYILFISFSICS
jgi:D-3-phosphoglycerate dehydrogenase